MRNIETFVYSSDSIFDRVSVFTFSILTWYFGFKFVNPWYQNLLNETFRLNSLFLKHLVYFSLATTIVCLLFYGFAVKASRFKPLNFRLDSKSIGFGVIAGTVISAVILPWAMWKGWSIGFNFDIYKIAGNLFSNTYEEFQYRVVILFGALYAFRNPIPALFLSGLIFAWTHANYPLDMQVAVGFSGIVMGYFYMKTGSFSTAIVGHQVADMILDTLLLPPG